MTRTLVDASVRNGGFESGSGNNTITDWQTGFVGTEAQRKENNASSGAWSLVLGKESGDNGDELSANTMTDHVVVPGDSCDLSFSWLPKSNWQSTDEIRWRLFTTYDDTFSGALTEFASGTVSGAANGAAYQSASITSQTNDNPIHHGRRLWLQFIRGATGGANRFARLDDVTLTVTTDISPNYVSLLPGDMLAYYPLEEDVLDYSAENPMYDGSWSAGEAYAPGKIGTGAADFSDLSAAVAVPHILRHDFTLSFWLKAVNPAVSGAQWWHGEGLIDGHVVETANDLGVSLNGMHLAFGAGNPDTTVFSSSLVTDGEWHHVAVQRHSLSGTMRLFINGALESEVEGPAGTRDAGGAIAFGSLLSGTGFADGCLDDVRVFDVLLDEASIQALYVSAGDFDQDGDTDLAELAAVSDWMDGESGLPDVTMTYLPSEPSVAFDFEAFASRDYTLQRSTSLDSWSDVGQPEQLDYHGPMTLTDDSPPIDKAFYQINIKGRGPAREKSPNIVFIYGDDVGFGDVSSYNPASKINTPNIDTLALQGIRFTDGHCMASTCSPSRFAMLTGIFAFRHGVGIIQPTGDLKITESMYTLPDMLKDNGYNTAVIGKWHLGMGNGGDTIQWNGDISPCPLDIGFDYSFILPTTNDRVPSIYMEDRRLVNADYIEAADEVTNPGTGTLTVRPMSLDDNDNPVNDPVYVHNNSYSAVNVPGSTIHPRYSDTVAADRLYNSNSGHNNSFINGIGRIGYFSGGAHALWEDQTQAFVFLEKAREYIAAQDNETPFFLYFASQDIHVPRAPHEAFQGATNLGWRGDAMVQFDWTVGQIMQALEDAGLTNDTIVFLSSDNGHVYGDGYADDAGNDEDQGHDASGPWRGGKYSNREGGTRVPFVVRWPAKIQPTVSDALMNQTDLMATLADLLGYELPAGSARDSRSVLPAFLGNDSVGAEFTLQQNNNGNSRALRMGEMKYNNGGALFDLASDPTEQTDLSNNPAYEDIRDTMAAKYNEVINNPSNREYP